MVDPPRRLAAAVAGAGVVLCVLGWYQISGQPTVPQQLPYLASATIPGAALLVVGLVLALRAPLPRGTARYRGRGAEGPVVAGAGARAGTDGGVGTGAGAGGQARYWRVPDGRYLHLPECPLLDGRTDAFPADESPADTAAEDAGETVVARPCPVCRPDAADADPR